MGRISDLKRKKFAAAFIETDSTAAAAKASGYTPGTAAHLVTMPEVRAEIDKGISEAAQRAGVTRQWVIEKLKEVALRCLQGEPVLDKLGHETGEWKFDSGGANRALELIGKHLRLWGDDSSPTAQLGAAVIRVLAQEAQASRLKAVQAAIPSTAPAPERVPPVESQKSLAPGMADMGALEPSNHQPSVPPAPFIEL